MSQLAEVKERLEALRQQHYAGFVNLTALLDAEGLLTEKQALKRGPLTLATHLFSESVDALMPLIEATLFEQEELSAAALRRP